MLQARAVYSPDYQRKGEPKFSLYYPAERPLSLHALTRHRLVKQMAERDGQIDIEHLLLTALGADASFYYASQKTVDQIIDEQLAAGSDPGTELRIWKHRSVIGRDVFFIEAFFGFLFPFCHPAIYVDLTQRKFAAYTDDEISNLMIPIFFIPRPNPSHRVHERDTRVHLAPISSSGGFILLSGPA